MTVTVLPAEFSLVQFENADIVDIVRGLLDDVGLPVDLDVVVNIDERVQLGRADIESVDPVSLDVEGGALEDPKRPRQFSAGGTRDTLGRLLMRVRDRRDPTFGDPPAEGELTLAHKVAWDVYCVARLSRRGHRAQRQRRLYSFRTRHGFTDASDAAFDELWTREDLTWTGIVAISDRAYSVPAPAST